jgi:hypothetical protein
MSAESGFSKEMHAPDVLLRQYMYCTPGIGVGVDRRRAATAPFTLGYGYLAVGIEHAGSIGNFSLKFLSCTFPFGLSVALRCRMTLLTP